MPKAENDPNTGGSAVASEIQTAGPGDQNGSGLTGGCKGIHSAAGESYSTGNAPFRSAPVVSDCDDHSISPETAAAAVALTAPSILDLGRQLAAAEIAYNAFDDQNLRRSLNAGDADAERKMKLRNQAAWKILVDRAEALRDLIASIPAVSIQDAAVQIGVICTASARLAASVHTQEQKEAIADGIERMALSALPIIAKAAGLDLEAMDWLGNEHLRIHRFEGVGVTS